jgi:hypothetical protein
MNARMHACMYVCMHVCMHACMHVCICVYIGWLGEKASWEKGSGKRTSRPTGHLVEQAPVLPVP